MPFLGPLANDSAMRTLVKAYYRWRKESTYTEKENRSWIVILKALNEVMVSDEPSRIPKPPAFAFLRSLRPIEPTDLPEDSRECQICLRTYRPVSVQKCVDKRSRKSCVAMRLPCGHVLGSRCMVKWLNQSDGVYNNNCPICRRKSFSKPADIDTVEGLQERVDLVDWCVENRSRVPSAKEKMLVSGWTKSIVSIRLARARRELVYDTAKLALETSSTSREQAPSPLFTKQDLRDREQIIELIGIRISLSDLDGEMLRHTAQLMTARGETRVVEETEDREERSMTTE